MEKQIEKKKHLTANCKHPGSYPLIPGNPEGWCLECRRAKVQALIEQPKIKQSIKIKNRKNAKKNNKELLERVGHKVFNAVYDLGYEDGIWE